MSHSAKTEQTGSDMGHFYDIHHSAAHVPLHSADGNWADQFVPNPIAQIASQIGHHAQFRQPPPPMIQHFGPPMFQNPIYIPHAPIYNPAISSTTTTSNPLSVNDDLAAAKRMVEMLRNSGNPKYANSTFVDFIDQVANKELKFKDGEVVDREGKVVDWDSIYETEETETVGGIGSMLEGIGDDSENLPDQMERIWNELRNDNDFLRDGRQASGAYDFKYTDNPYIESSENLIELAMKLMMENRDIDAMKALEAEVRINPNSSEGWKLLGQLHAQFDCDSEAIKCLEKGHACDAYNLESMMALGVSLTNELDSIRAMEILQQWIKNHDLYHDLVSEPSGDSDDKYPDYDFVGLKKEVML
jgi:peroxin-5